MTTPNTQPTPPEGMEILTDYTKPLSPLAVVWCRDYLEGGQWLNSIRTGMLPLISSIYAIPITPTVPATGDTNEKGGGICVVCGDSFTRPTTPGFFRPKRCIKCDQPGVQTSPATVSIQSMGDAKLVEQRQELLPCPFCGASDWKQDDDISDWRVLTHKPECFLAEDKLGRTRQEIISLPNKEAQQWNTRK